MASQGPAWATLVLLGSAPLFHAPLEVTVASAYSPLARTEAGSRDQALKSLKFAV